jgi:hypothetical protein
MTKRTIILIGFIIVKFVLQYFLYNDTYDLHRDEYLHLDQANHLAWGYQSVPPVTSWVAYLIKLLGNSVFWVKFFPALFGALTILVVWRAIEELGGSTYALILGSTCILFSVLLRINFLFQPNSLDVLCWTTIYYLLVKYINSGKTTWLYIGSLVLAVGFLNKYNVVFLMIGLLPALLLANTKKLFLKKELVIPGLLALLLILPNLAWQYNNDFPVVHHMKALVSTQLVNVERGSFLKEQLFYFIGSLPVIFAALYAFLFYEPFTKYRLFFWSLIFTLAVFVYFRAKGYYAIGVYPIYIAFGAVFIGNALHKSWKKPLQLVLVAIPVFFYMYLFNIITIKDPEYILTHKSNFEKLGLLRWEDGKNYDLPQDFADMLGWKELAEKVNAIYNKLPKPERIMILCDNYGQAGAINYYSNNKQVRAVSFNADYINWIDTNITVQSFIRVKTYSVGEDELKETSPYFQAAYKADSIANPLAREYRTAVFVFINPNVDVMQKIKEEIETVRQH